MVKDTKSGIIVIQFDDIIINTNYERYRNLFCDKLMLNRFCEYTKLLTIDEFNNRGINMFFGDIIRSDLDQERIEEAIIEISRKHANVNYNNCIPTTLCKNVLKNINYLESNTIKDIYILVDYPSGRKDLLDAKVDFISKNFTNQKIHILKHVAGTSIYECLEKYIPDWTLFVTDNRHYVIEISEKYKSLKDKEINFAIRGYNKYNYITDILISEKDGCISKFDN